MANFDQELLSVLRDIKASLNSGRYSRDNKHARKDNTGYKSEELAEQASKLSQAFEDQHISLGKFTKSVLHEVIPSLKVMNQGFDGARNSLKEYTKYSDNTFKNISSASFEIFAKVTGNSKKFQKEFDDIISAQIAAKKSLENAIKDLDNKKNSKANINDAKIAVESLAKSKFGDAFAKSIDKNTMKALENGKVTKAQLTELNEHISQMMAGTMAGGRFAMMGSNSIKGLAAKSLVTFLGDILPKIASQGMKDYRANRYYGVGGTTYGANIEHLLGMSEEERSQLVGKNKQVFSLLGNGNLNASFENGTFSRLQDNMLTEFGFTGKQAAEEIVKNMNAVFNSGFAVTGNNLEKFNKSLNEASRLAKMTPDEFRDFFSQMGNAGQIAQFRQAMPGKTDEQQMKALMQNTAILIKVNQNLGLNNEEIKKQNQTAYNATHAGFLKTIMNQVGAGITAQELKTQNNDPRSIEDIQESLNFSRLEPAEQARLLGTGKYTQAFAKQAAQDRLNARALPEEQRRNAYFNSLNNGSSLSNALISGSANQFWSELVRGTFGSDIAGESAEDSMQAIGQKDRGRNNNTATTVIDPTTDSLKAMRDAIGNEQSGLIESLMKAKNVLDTIGGNPLTNGAASVAEGVGLGWLLSKSGNLIKGAGSSIGRLFGIGGSAAVEGTAAAEGTVGATAAGGSLIASGAALASSALAGWGIGTGINKLWDSTKVGSKANDAIFAIASSPLEAVALKFRAMSDPTFLAFLNSLSDKQMDDMITKKTLQNNPALAASIAQAKAKVISPIKQPGTTSSSTTAISGLQTLFDTITRGEGGARAYDSLYGGSDLAQQMFGKPLSQLTIGQVKQVQQQMQKNGMASNAAGAFQIMGRNMDTYAKGAGLSDTDMFNQSNQQKMAMQGWNRPGTSWNDFLSGKISPEQILNKVFTNEYAAIADTNGYSPYAKDGINHPSLFAPTMLPILKQIQDQALNKDGNSTDDLLSEMTTTFSKLVQISSKILDVNTEHLDVTKKDINQNSDQALVNQRVANMQKLSQNAQQSIFNTIASHNVPPS